MPLNQSQNTSKSPVSATEVLEKPQPRKFTAEYKLRILAEGDRPQEPGQIGGILRREGLYSSHLSTWRKQREQGQLQALGNKQRGRPVQSSKELKAEIDKLRSDNQRLAKKLKQAELRA
ncbi:MAG: transposase [Microcystaceae cyanobacterium]